jgi:hypothetical protein
LATGVFEGDIEVVRDHLGNAIGVGVLNVHYTGQVTHDHLCTELAVGDDVGDPVAAIFFADIVDDLVATAHAEIDVKVRRGDPLEGEHPLEEEPEAERIDIGYLQDIGDEAAGTGTAPRPDRDVLRSRAQSMKSHVMRK